MPASFFCCNLIFCRPFKATCHARRAAPITNHLRLWRNHHARRAALITNHVAARQLITYHLRPQGAIITARSALLPRIYAANNGHFQRKRALLFATGFAAAAVCFYKHVAVEFCAFFAAHFVPARGEEIDSLCIGQRIYAPCARFFKPHFGSV